MKLTYFQLEAHLAKKIIPLYLISGDELLLKQDAKHWIRKAAKQAGFNERIRLSAEAANGDELYSLLYSNSLLADKRLLELDFRDTNPNKMASKVLQEYAEKPFPDTILLIDTGKMDAKLARSAWVKSCEAAGVLVAIWPIPREQLSQWIQKRAHKYKLQFNPDAASLLADYVEGNLIAAAQTIEKLYLLKPEHAITQELVQTLLTDESRFTIFDFIDSLVEGGKARSLHILEHLKDEGTEPVLILWGITRELRLLAEYAKQLQAGCTLDMLFQKYHIFSRRQAPIRRFLNKFNHADCLRLLSHAAEIDKVIKGAVQGDSHASLQLLCLRFAS